MNNENSINDKYSWLYIFINFLIYLQFIWFNYILKTRVIDNSPDYIIEELKIFKNLLLIGLLLLLVIVFFILKYKHKKLISLFYFCIYSLTFFILIFSLGLSIKEFFIKIKILIFAIKEILILMVGLIFILILIKKIKILKIIMKLIYIYIILYLIGFFIIPKIYFSNIYNILLGWLAYLIFPPILIGITGILLPYYIFIKTIKKEKENDIDIVFIILLLIEYFLLTIIAPDIIIEFFQQINIITNIILYFVLINIFLIFIILGIYKLCQKQKNIKYIIKKYIAIIIIIITLVFVCIKIINDIKKIQTNLILHKYQIYHSKLYQYRLNNLYKSINKKQYKPKKYIEEKVLAKEKIVKVVKYGIAYGLFYDGWENMYGVEINNKVIAGKLEKTKINDENNKHYILTIYTNKGEKYFLISLKDKKWFFHGVLFAKVFMINKELNPQKIFIKIDEKISKMELLKYFDMEKKEIKETIQNIVKYIGKEKEMFCDKCKEKKLHFYIGPFGEKSLNVFVYCREMKLLIFIERPLNDLNLKGIKISYLKIDENMEDEYTRKIMQYGFEFKVKCNGRNKKIMNNTYNNENKM